jgi:hypothetical protein
VIGIRSDWWFGWLVIFVLDIRRAFDTHNVLGDGMGWECAAWSSLRETVRSFDDRFLAFFFSISAAFALDLVVDVC